MDTVSRSKRSAVMRAIRSTNTRPEIALRKLLFRMGYRYRIHARELPGKPDVVFRSRRLAIFVNGCFWHFHRRCGTAHFPESRLWYWRPKLENNKKRDFSNRRKLKRMGWQVLVIWECELKSFLINVQFNFFFMKILPILLYRFSCVGMLDVFCEAF
jgi:DNA mismatch endonuclease, patch repair protein